jgi:hypothetical protein
MKISENEMKKIGEGNVSMKAGKASIEIGEMACVMTM